MRGGPPPEQLEVGAAVIVLSKPYAGFDTEVIGIPLINYTRDRLFIRGPAAGYRLLQTDSLAFDLYGKWTFYGYDADDSSDLDGMSDREMTAMAGTSISLFDDWGMLKLTALNDLCARHSGQELTLTYSRQFTSDMLTLTPSVGIFWQSSGLVDYYYGVRSGEVTAARPAYDADSEFGYSARISARYQLDDQWSVVSGVTFQYYGHEVTDSPIVDEHYGVGFNAGFLYKF
jgi:outer membrane protein